MPFADYGFNAAARVRVRARSAYQTAYLKRHHPVEYMAALLTSVKDDKDNKPFYLNAARLMSIPVLPPDVNESQVDFAPADGDIRYGLSAVRNVGVGAVQQIIRARTEKGRFESFTDFCRKVDASVLHKKVLESLILSGAFDSLGYRRRALLEGYEKVTTPVLADRRAEAVGQESFFGGERAELLAIDESVLAGEEFDRTDFLRQEKEMLGQYVTDHPLLAHQGPAWRSPTGICRRALARGRRRRDGGRHRGRDRPQVHQARRALRHLPARRPDGRRRCRGLPVGLRQGRGGRRAGRRSWS